MSLDFVAPFFVCFLRFCVCFLLVTETINFYNANMLMIGPRIFLEDEDYHYLELSLWKCDLLKSTTNGDPAEARTGDLSAQSSRLYHCASLLHLSERSVTITT